MMNIQNISDEDLMNMEVPPVFAAAAEPDKVEEQQQDDTDTPTSDDTQDDDVEAGTEGVDEDAGGEASEDEGKEPEVPAVIPSDDELGEQPTPAAPAAKEAEPVKDEPSVDDKKAVKEPAPKTENEAPQIDYAAEYNKLVGTPIKANGKEITLKDTNEVLRLVQQGANYAKKMEELKPARRSAAMLEAAGLLGNDLALAQAIDLYNGKPEAIARMVKDRNIDILSMDMDAGDNYTAESHLQTDEQVTFVDTLKEVRTLPGGNEAMQLIDSWDDASKDLVWGNAKAIREIYDYKQSGVYDTVATEVERRKTLGMIPEGTPFIAAFVAVGEELAKNAPVVPANNAEPEHKPSTVVAEPAKPAARTPVATGTAPRKAPVNDPRAAAAAAPRGGAGPAKSIPNIYSLSDADIEKMASPQG